MNAPRVGSLFTGTGALDLAVEEVFGASTAWHCQYDPEDKYQYAARICAAHWPAAPNHGDITTVDFTQVEPIDILTGGFPCTDLSLAGQRAGIAEGTRSGLWLHMARAIRELQPRLVVIENVRGLLSAPAHSHVEPCAGCLGDADGKPPLRALGAVLGDLAELGFDAEWVGLPASAVGAPHERFREFVLAWPSAAQGTGLERAGVRGHAAERGASAADTDDLGHERAGTARGRREGSAHNDLAPADTSRGGRASEAAPDPDGHGRDEGRPESAKLQRRPDAVKCGGEAAPDADGGGREGNPERHSEPIDGQPESEPGLDTDGRGVQRGTPAAADDGWGAYEPAVRRWEHILGRPAPSPVDALGRLNPALVEWMMGLPAGWFMDVPGAPGMSVAALRNARLKAGGNGVVRQQAEAALRILCARMLAPGLIMRAAA